MLKTCHALWVVRSMLGGPLNKLVNFKLLHHWHMDFRMFLFCGLHTIALEIDFKSMIKASWKSLDLYVAPTINRLPRATRYLTHCVLYLWPISALDKKQVCISMLMHKWYFSISTYKHNIEQYCFCIIIQYAVPLCVPNYFWTDWPFELVAIWELPAWKKNLQA